MKVFFTLVALFASSSTVFGSAQSVVCKSNDPTYRPSYTVTLTPYEISCHQQFQIKLIRANDLGGSDVTTIGALGLGKMSDQKFKVDIFPTEKNPTGSVKGKKLKYGVFKAILSFKNQQPSELTCSPEQGVSVGQETLTTDANENCTSTSTNEFGACNFGVDCEELDRKSCESIGYGPIVDHEFMFHGVFVGGICGG